ncbi:NAD-dependent epimerase/dehydratase family protein [Risungbinella massiliensis]|uniref:NAD-dependent epimerase/dehydratase family protein n=1 Tax=Risungbinella massiliensis TaxID=1329796 RepID=UPI0005CC3FB4|nr:NAD-dependent epimerase/dehydratase family protein [Risungbinella massiliensis]
MKLLVLGGTQFVGRYMVEAALSKGWEVTLFHRGKTNQSLFPNVERILGDRENEQDLAKLKDHKWDAVLDVCGFTPDVVRKSLAVLSHVPHYTYISTVSVYQNGFYENQVTEDSPLATLEEERVLEIRKQDNWKEYYGELKALCEKATLEYFPANHLIIRPGLVVGPYDHSDRFTYWVERIAEGGEVLVPKELDSVQFIDVRDLANYTIQMIEQRQIGIFNGIGPAEKMSMRQFVEETKVALQSNATFTYVEDSFLLEYNVGMWVEFPLWIPGGRQRFLPDKAMKSGLTLHPLSETVQDINEWCQTRQEQERKAGLDRRKEQGILKEWNRSENQ